ncbi:metallophosphoesterase [Methanococcus maripaludis]|uniref:UDP-2,3-diacylglucosamine pyrophosphatase LpxH n=1 Tax=Methanococcus maripaludis TaxID=39152 RepID=A0A7J9S7C7_METMI|nr:metallophosphoesterase [Methanococcus maripaludis]MBB6495983.1 UDP-2,3-diacylglucosamine pyrophosphatase LpxH [Methanococcus maripaludis]
MEMFNKVIVVSDLHLGGDNSVKNPFNLISFFRDDNRFNDSIIVIAGDLLDSWAQTCKTKPPSYVDMIKNSIIWNQIINRAKKTPTWFINGNHDMDLDLTEIGVEDIIQDDPKDLCLDIFQNRLYIEHGNCVDLFNAKPKPRPCDDPILRYPLGYYKTRLNHTKKTIPMQKDHFVNAAKYNVIQMIYDLKCNNEKINDDFLSEISQMLIEGFEKDIKIQFRVDDINNVKCRMNDGTEVGYGDILKSFRDFVKRFYIDNLLPSLSKDQQSDQFIYDNFANSIDVVQTGGLFWYSQSIFDLYGADKIIFGHTHMNQLNVGQNFVYANSGCWCANPFGPNVTNIEIDLDENKVLSRNETISFNI